MCVICTGHVKEQCPECQEGYGKLISHDANGNRIGIMVSLQCERCGYDWQTVVGHAKDEMLKDTLDVVGD